MAWTQRRRPSAAADPDAGLEMGIGKRHSENGIRGSVLSLRRWQRDPPESNALRLVRRTICFSKTERMHDW